MVEGDRPPAKRPRSCSPSFGLVVAPVDDAGWALGENRLLRTYVLLRPREGRAETAPGPSPLEVAAIPRSRDWLAEADPGRSGADLAAEVEARFGVRLHRRTIERARR